MFCTKCGAKNADGARFCAQCGNKMAENIPKIRPDIRPDRPKRDVIPETVMPEIKENVSEPKVKKKIKVFPIILFVALLAVVIIFPRFILSGNDEKKAVEEFIDAEFTGDADKIMDLIPEKLFEKITEEDDISKEEAAEMLGDMMSSLREKMDETLGEGWKYSCKVNDISEVTGEKYNDIIENYKEISDDMGISEATIAETEISVSGKDIDNSVTIDVPMIKIDDKWYLDFFSFDVDSIDISSLL